MADEAKTDEELAAEVAAAAKPAAIDGNGDDLNWDEESEGGSEAGEEKPQDRTVAEQVADGTIKQADESGTPVEAEPPGETTVRKLTRYVVLEAVNVKMGTESVEMFRRVGDEGRTFEGPRALDQAHRTLEREHGALVAIPERSWKPKRPVEKPRPPVMEWE